MKYIKYAIIKTIYLDSVFHINNVYNYFILYYTKKIFFKFKIYNSNLL